VHHHLARGANSPIFEILPSFSCPLVDLFADVMPNQAANSLPCLN